MPQPDFSRLTGALKLEFPLIGFYDVPDTAPFAPLVKPHGCMFEHAKDWKLGYSVVLSPRHIGCRGAGHWLCGVEARTPEQLAKFLTEEEGLKNSMETTRTWLDEHPPYNLVNGNIVVGPLREEYYDYVQTITFLVTPDQLAMMITGSEYSSSDATPLTRAPFGSGCMQLAPLTADSTLPAAWISLTDMAMRKYLHQNILGFTVTKPMFELLCKLDQNSFLGKRFWRELLDARFN